MKLNNHGWGLKEMLFFSAILLFFVLLVSVLINSLYSQLDLSNNGSSSNPSSSTNNGYTYKDIETNLKIAARRYIKNHADDDSEILTSDELIENKYLTSSKLKTSNDTCEGYVMITDDYEAFIHCNNYETEGY